MESAENFDAIRDQARQLKLAAMIIAIGTFKQACFKTAIDQNLGSHSNFASKVRVQRKLIEYSKVTANFASEVLVVKVQFRKVGSDFMKQQQAMVTRLIVKVPEEVDSELQQLAKVDLAFK